METCLWVKHVTQMIQLYNLHLPPPTPNECETGETVSHPPIIIVAVVMLVVIVMLVMIAVVAVVVCML